MLLGIHLPTAQNLLIERLPLKERTSLLALCESVELVRAEVLSKPGTPSGHVYFPTEGSISLVATAEGTSGVEVGMVGREGMLGAELALDMATAPMHSLVQVPGVAWRVESGAFRRELESAAPLRRTLQRYLYVLMAQLATSAACLRFHLIRPRLARWLLMTQDRAHADNFHVTHELIGSMLGVRRVGVTVAAGALQRAGLISYHRGDFTVLDRKGLEAAACTCYAAGQKSYADVLEDRRGGADRRTHRDPSSSDTPNPQGRDD